MMEPANPPNGHRRLEVVFPATAGQPRPSSIPGPRNGSIELSPQAMRMLETRAPHKRSQDAEPTGAVGLAERAETQPDGGVPPEAAEALIEGKRIGERIKFLRQRKHMGLVELGRYTGLSASFLSQLETGRVVPTLRNLARIAMVFSRDLSYFFEPERPELFKIQRASERQRMPQTGAAEPDYFFESLGQVPTEQVIAPYVAEFVTGGGRSPAAHQHTGAEFLYMLSGRLRLVHEGRAEVLERGDAVYFDPSVKHSYERMGEETCTALILTIPEPMRSSQTPARMGPQSQAAANGGAKKQAR